MWKRFSTFDKDKRKARESVLEIDVDTLNKHDGVYFFCCYLASPQPTLDHY